LKNVSEAENFSVIDRKTCVRVDWVLHKNFPLLTKTGLKGLNEAVTVHIVKTRL
jgi:hypothetical protein